MLIYGILNVNRKSKEKERNEMIVKRIDFEHGSIPSNILNAAIPMVVAQLLSLLYNS